MLGLTPTTQNGVEKKEDELATLYDVLFDDEMICGVRIYTETLRCYRLTKQAFINLTFGLKKQLGPTPTKAGLEQNWRKTDSTGANKETRSNSSPQQSNSPRPALQNWRTNDSSVNNQGSNRNSPRPSQPQNSPNPTNKVSQFFSAYRQQINADNINRASRLAKEGNEPGNQLRPEVPQTQNAQNSQQSLDAVFQNMWSQLQLQKSPSVPPPTGNPAMPPPVAMQPPGNVISYQAVSEQTNALKKALQMSLKISDTPSEAKVPNQPQAAKRPCGHTQATCGAELASMCNRLGIVYPTATYSTDPATSEVCAVLTFADGVEIVSSRWADKAKASESVACAAVTHYPEMMALRLARQSSKGLAVKGGPPGVPVTVRGAPFPQGIPPMRGGGMFPGAHPVGRGVVVQEMMRMPPQMANRPPYVLPNPPQNLLPTPPRQWCQPELKPAMNMMPPFANSTQQSKPKTNPFVPLQAQAAAIMQTPKPVEPVPSPNGVVNKPIPQSPQKVPAPPASTTAALPTGDRPSRTNRRGRIAAKFSQPLS
ncbi:Hypothetical protein NTJ_12664 [Nesidiocoris tenuis]|uniref:DRBM domain-containing protein n=1 Tax=Nesidiocoris tenuis TaxID=355587 RepID=A0ABN7BAK5_9HEMI|nr:Hypothetical protein NTJ_12664 [Nesidiocoris tenuis]